MREHKDELIQLETAEHGAIARHVSIMVQFAAANLELAASAARVLMGKVLPYTPSKGAPAGMSNTLVYRKYVCIKHI